MEITWHKDSCFRIKGKKTAIVINPTKESGKLKGDLVLSSIGENLSEVDGMHKLFQQNNEQITPAHIYHLYLFFQ